MTRVTRTIIFLFIITAMVVTASAGTIGGSTAGANAGVSGNGIAASYDWNAQYEAGIDQMGAVNQAGQSFSTSTTDNSQAGTNPGEFPEFMVMVKAKEIKISGQVTGPSGAPGSAMAIASVRALANREFEETGATQEDLSLETWIFAATHTYAGAEGVTATASATASGTATASAATDLGSAKAESKGKVTASSSATYANAPMQTATHHNRPPQELSMLPHTQTRRCWTPGIPCLNLHRCISSIRKLACWIHYCFPTSTLGTA